MNCNNPIENLSDKEILELYDDVIYMKNFISSCNHWYVFCDNGIESSNSGDGNNSAVGYCYRAGCGKYSESICVVCGDTGSGRACGEGCW